jgi:hypothetical protein
MKAGRTKCLKQKVGRIEWNFLCHSYALAHCLSHLVDNSRYEVFGQEGKLKEVFGQIVVDKVGEGTSVATGEAADDFLGMGDVNGIYEA